MCCIFIKWYRMNSDSSIVTSNETKRLIYFIGHKNQPRSVLITQVCRDFETFRAFFSGEFASRTLSNLYNLHTVRGIIKEGVLVFETSMSGPHHYFGYLNPMKKHTLEFKNGFPLYREVKHEGSSIARLELPDEYITSICEYKWIQGNHVTQEMRERYSIKHEVANPLLNIDTGKVFLSTDSLFENPGIFELPNKTLHFRILTEAYKYDLSRFHAQIVPNHIPFGFDLKNVQKHKHAQHKLRIVTYNYGDRYIEDYILPGNGIFIERHEFIQAISPMNEQCGGYVLLGREVDGKSVELIAATVPYGYTLLVDVGCIHGDSTLTGLYSMAMTGNHHAMSTADTVFMKSTTNRKSVAITTDPVLPRIPGMKGDSFLLTSDAMSETSLREISRKLREEILKSHDCITSLWFEPVFNTSQSLLALAQTTGLGRWHPFIENAGGKYKVDE